MRCSLHGRIVEANDVCSCSPRKTLLKAEPGNLRITANPIGVVVEGSPDSPDGRVVDSKPASGGRSHSKVDRDGTFTVELSGQLHKGRANEARVLKVLLQALRNRGVAAGALVGGQDHRGEDALVDLEGRRIAVQVVTVPVDPSLWRHLSAKGIAIKSVSRSLRRSQSRILVPFCLACRSDRAVRLSTWNAGHNCCLRGAGPDGGREATTLT